MKNQTVTIRAGVTVPKCQHHKCTGHVYIPTTLDRLAQMRAEYAAGHKNRIIRDVKFACGHARTLELRV